MINRLFLLISFNFLPAITRGEYFSSISGLKVLVKSEEVLLQGLYSYITDQEQQILELKKLLKDLTTLNRDAKKENYLDSPVNQYLLVKRLAMDWKRLEQDLEKRGIFNTVRVNIENLQEKNYLATEQDLAGAAMGIFRLQETYLLNATDLAKGRVGQTVIDSSLSINDCYELGFQAYIIGKYALSGQWLLEAYQRLESPKEDYPFYENLLIALHDSYYQLGYVNSALDFIEELLTAYPGSTDAKDAERLYRHMLGLPLDEDRESKDPYIYDHHEQERYRAACRGDLKKSAIEEAGLKCRLIFDRHPSLTIAPAKVEEVNLRPLIVIFHDIVLKSEMEKIIKISQDSLLRSEVMSEDLQKPSETSQYRVSKDHPLHSGDHPFLVKLEQRVEAFTGLSLKTMEPHNILNYGIGGHYEPHIDFTAVKFGIRALEGFEDMGNRIATLVLYLSDVLQGGSTVFPYLNVKVDPTKGTGLFWHNLYKDGEGNFLTRHAACPVLLGSKWCDNIWIRERGQEFNRKCDLKPDSEPDSVWLSKLERNKAVKM